MSLRSLLIEEMDVLEKTSKRELSGDAATRRVVVKQGVPVRKQPLPSTKVLDLMRDGVRGTHRIYFQQGTELDERNQVEIGGTRFDLVSVEAASEPGRPNVAIVEELP